MFLISQFPKSPQPIWPRTLWEIEKWEIRLIEGDVFMHTPCVCLYKQIQPTPCWPRAIAEIWKWTGVHVMACQFSKLHQPIWPRTFWKLGKFGNGLGVNMMASQFPNFPNHSSPQGPELFGKLRSPLPFPSFPNHPSAHGQELFVKLGNCEIDWVRAETLYPKLI